MIELTRKSKVILNSSLGREKGQQTHVDVSSSNHVIWILGQVNLVLHGVYLQYDLRVFLRKRTIFSEKMESHVAHP